jgi:mRNA-degrading endonuclease RelE of RelBE toxin-antitoxin system
LKAAYLPGFVKDLKALRGAPEYSKVYQLSFEDARTAAGLEQIPGVTKLRGFQNAYRIRIGNYRVGFLFDGATLTFARVLDRKEIYRFFP